MELQDLKMAGSGSIAGGNYNIVSIAGSASTNGNINCKQLKVSGSASFNGDVIVDEASIAGAIKILNNLKGNKIKASGTIKALANIECEELNISGSISVIGECNIENLCCSGEGKFNNIYGETIELKSKKRNIKVNEIEATNINLKSVQAKRISGDNVRVEGKSMIDVIEYRRTLQISKQVTVLEIVKL